MRYSELTMEEYWALKRAARRSERLKKDIGYLSIWFVLFIGLGLVYRFVAHLGWWASFGISLGIVLLGLVVEVFVMEECK